MGARCRAHDVGTFAQAFPQAVHFAEQHERASMQQRRRVCDWRAGDGRHCVGATCGREIATEKMMRNAPARDIAERFIGFPGVS